MQMSCALKYDIKWKKWSNLASARLGKQVHLTWNTLWAWKAFYLEFKVLFFVEFLIIFNQDYFLSLLEFVVEMNTFPFLTGDAFRVQSCNVK